MQRRKLRNASAMTWPPFDKVTAPLVLVGVPLLGTPVDTFDPELAEEAPGRVRVTTDEVGEMDTVDVPSSTVK
jgi:hypothetical protein